ncbi:hypothetical protein MRX96_051158 [Rhipicephalus microplus]
MGFLHGMDGDAADENLLSRFQSTVRVLSPSREGRTVPLCFEGPVPSHHVALFRDCSGVSAVAADHGPQHSQDGMTVLAAACHVESFDTVSSSQSGQCPVLLHDAPAPFRPAPKDGP